MSHVLRRDPLAVVVDHESCLVAVTNRAHPDHSAPARVLDCVMDQIVEDVLDPIAIDHDCERVFLDLSRKRYATGVCLRLESMKRFLNESARGQWLQVKPNPPLLDSGEIEKVIDHGQDSFGVLARCQKQLDLLGCERTDHFLEQQVNRHLHAGERGLELVADSRDHVAFESIEQMKLGHVDKGDGGSNQFIVPGADRHDPGQIVALLAAVGQGNGLFE